MTDRQRVVLVDDDDEVRALLGRALELDPRFVVAGEARDGRAAIERVRALHPEVVLLDLAMPVMDGLEALPHLRAASPESVIVIMSGFQRAPLWPSAKRSGAVGYLEKGLPASEIAANVALLVRMLGMVRVLLGRPVGREIGVGEGDVSSARRFVSDALRDQLVGPALGDVALMVSELVTNAILHARAVPHVVVQLDATHVRVDVQDPSATRPVPRRPDERAPGGRGLLIVQSLADAWGVDVRPTGKSVWFSVRRDLPTSAAHRRTATQRS